MTPTIATAEPPLCPGGRELDTRPDWLADVGDLHDDTSPESIAEAQRREVSRAARLLGPDAVAVSAEVVLPVSVVTRRLADLGLIDAARPSVPSSAPPADRPGYGSAVPLLSAALASGPKTARELAALTRLKGHTVHASLRRRPDLFREVRRIASPGRGRARILWGLQPQGG